VAVGAGIHAHGGDSDADLESRVVDAEGRQERWGVRAVPPGKGWAGV